MASTQSPQSRKVDSSNQKVIVKFKAVGGASSLPDKFNNVKCNRSDKLQRVLDWLNDRYRATSATPPRHVLCLYVKMAFMPPLEEELGALADAYGVTTTLGAAKELMLEYCDQPNWGPHFFKAPQAMALQSS